MPGLAHSSWRVIRLERSEQHCPQLDLHLPAALGSSVPQAALEPLNPSTSFLLYQKLKCPSARELMSKSRVFPQQQLVLA